MKNRPVSPVLVALVALVVSTLALPPDLRSQACPDGGVIKPQTTVQEALRAIGVNLTNLCAVTPITATTTPGASAVPRATSAGTLDPGWTKHSRVVILDSSGGGDFTTLSAAIAYVASQSPAVISPWTIVVMPGSPGAGAEQANYTESGNLTVPIQTIIQGYAQGTLGASVSINPGATIKFTCATGTCLKLGGGSSLSFLNILYKGTPTANVTVIEANNTGSGSVQGQNIYMVNEVVQPQSSAFEVDGVLNTVGSMYMAYSSVTMVGGSSLNQAILNNDTVSGRGITIFGGRFSGQSGCARLMNNAAASGGTIQLFSVRADPNKCTTDLTNAGTGPFNVTATPFSTSSGTINQYGPTYTQYGATNPATCSPGQDFTNTTTPAVCRCITANTWKCITLL